MIFLSLLSLYSNLSGSDVGALHYFKWIDESFFKYNI